MFWYWNLLSLSRIFKIFDVPTTLKYNRLYEVFKRKFKTKMTMEENILFYKYLIVYECLCREQNISYFNEKVFFNKDKQELTIEGITDICFVQKPEYLRVISSLYSYYVYKLSKVYKKNT